MSNKPDPFDEYKLRMNEHYDRAFEQLNRNVNNAFDKYKTSVREFRKRLFRTYLIILVIALLVFSLGVLLISFLSTK